MSAPNLASVRATDHEVAIREFIEAEASALSPATASRYAIVAATLFEFLDVVDVRPRLGSDRRRSRPAAPPAAFGSPVGRRP